MAPVTDRPAFETPYQLDLPQTTSALRTLLKNIAEHKTSAASKPNLLAGDEDEDETPSDLADTPIWLTVATKKHIVDKKSLKPGKIHLPHSLNLSPATTICLITADPQRTYKDAVSDDSFPVELRGRITRVIGMEKLKARYKSFESKRQLLAEYDIFLADDRIVTFLPGFLGKTFYKGGAKRPIPISIAGQQERTEDGKKVKRTAEQKARDKGKGPGLGAAKPAVIAKEIENALSSTTVMLSPGTSVAVKVGRAAFTAEQVAENVKAVVTGLTEKYITKGWRNVRAIYVKGPNTVALPVWETDQLWVDDEDVLEEKPKFGGNKGKKAEPKEKLLTGAAADEVAMKNKRKAEDETAAKEATKKKRKSDTDPKLVSELAAKKEKVKKAKAKVMAEVDGSII